MITSAVLKIVMRITALLFSGVAVIVDALGLSISSIVQTFILVIGKIYNVANYFYHPGVLAIGFGFIYTYYCAKILIKTITRVVKLIRGAG